MWDVECGVEQNNREVDIDLLEVKIWAVWPCPSPSPRAGEEEATLTRSEAAAEAAGQAGTSCGAAESAPPPTAALAGGGGGGVGGGGAGGGGGGGGGLQLAEPAPGSQDQACQAPLAVDNKLDAFAITSSWSLFQMPHSTSPA